MHQAPGRCAALSLHGPVRPYGGAAITHSKNDVCSANAYIPLFLRKSAVQLQCAADERKYISYTAVDDTLAQRRAHGANLVERTGAKVVKELSSRCSPRFCIGQEH